MKSLSGAFADSLLASVRTLLPLAGASCYAVDSEGCPFGHRLSGLSMQQLREYRSRFCRNDPFYPALHDSADQDIVVLDDACSMHGRAGYVEEFLHRYGYCDEVEMFFRNKAGRIAIGIGMIREERDGRFRAGEIDMLRKVKPFLEMALASHLASSEDETRWRHSPYATALTQRETQVVEQLLRGASNREIAQSCGVTVATVKAHFFNIFSKTGVASRTELVTRLLGH